MNKFRTPAVLFVLVVGLFAAPTVLSQEDCEAYVNASLETNEQGEVTHLQFSVEVSTSESCARIEYDLILEELLPNGQTKKERIPRFVKLNDGDLNEMVRHEISSSLQLLNHEAKVVSCQKCSIMP
jgi:hypothetical protein